MKDVYVISDNIYSPLGKNTRANMDSLKKGETGIRRHPPGIFPEPFFASLLAPEDKAADNDLSAFEQVVLASAMDAIKNSPLPPDIGGEKTGFILSSTKGNISMVEGLGDKTIPEQNISLNTSAEKIAARLGVKTSPLVVSHACISGLLAMITGMRLIRAGLFDTLIISGGDLITSFIYSGFASFQAISPNPCRPFDATRDGISLGEGAATVILSSQPAPGAVRPLGGAVSNDANHISGPSRTGQELFMAVQSAMKQSGISGRDIQFISAHGTATRYNDDMEAKAIHLASMETVPVNSLKGYYGHTLGAAGILESVITIHSMKENILLPTMGYSKPGTEMPVNVIKELQPATLHTCLKTASGFGGCNAALVLAV